MQIDSKSDTPVIPLTESNFDPRDISLTHEKVNCQTVDRKESQWIRLIMNKMGWILRNPLVDEKGEFLKFWKTKLYGSILKWTVLSQRSNWRLIYRKTGLLTTETVHFDSSNRDRLVYGPNSENLEGLLNRFDLGISALIELFWGRHHCLKFVKNQLMMNIIEEKLLIKWWNSLVFLDDLPLLTIAETNISLGILALKCQKLNSWRRGWSNQKWCLLYYINDAQI